MKKQLYLGAKSKKDFESGYVKKRRKEKAAAAAKGGTWKTDVERTREVLKEFLYDPTRSTLTVLGSKKLVKNFDFKRDVLQTRDFMGLDEAGCIDRANELLAKNEFRNKWLGHLHQVGYKNT